MLSISEFKSCLPEDYHPYVDKYFTRTRTILKAENINPFIRGQVFVRKGPGVVAGIEKATAILEKYSRDKGGHLYVLKDGTYYSSCETLMIIEARIQDIVELETMYLGVISEDITLVNGGTDVDLGEVTRSMEKIVTAVENKPVYYGGARHWGFLRDKEISKAAFNGGAAGCSTDIGAMNIGHTGMGTIPHALECAMAWKYGFDNAVVESVLAFNRNIDLYIPRVALVDFANKEIDDSLKCASKLKTGLSGIRVDTCGENISQGAVPPVQEIISKIPEQDKQFWFGYGVTIDGILALRNSLDYNKFNFVDIIVSSGFGDPAKDEAFTRAEDILQMRLFNSVLVGGVFKSRAATMDIVAIGEDLDHMDPIVKVGRMYRPNPQLVKVF